MSCALTLHRWWRRFWILLVSVACDVWSDISMLLYCSTLLYHNFVSCVVASSEMRCVSHLLWSHLQQQCPACVCSAGPASLQYVFYNLYRIADALLLRALDCVLDIPSNIPYAALFPYKKLVTKALMVGTLPKTITDATAHRNSNCALPLQHTLTHLCSSCSSIRNAP